MTKPLLSDIIDVVNHLGGVFMSDLFYDLLTTTLIFFIGVWVIKMVYGIDFGYVISAYYIGAVIACLSIASCHFVYKIREDYKDEEIKKS